MIKITSHVSYIQNIQTRMNQNTTYYGPKFLKRKLKTYLDIWMDASGKLLILTFQVGTLASKYHYSYRILLVPPPIINLVIL